MDKIWYRNPSKLKVIGRCGGDEKTEWPRKTDKSRTLKNNYLKRFVNKVNILKTCLNDIWNCNKKTNTYFVLKQGGS